MTNTEAPTNEESVQGVEFGDLRDDLRNHVYPASGDELVEDYGTREITVQDTTETLKDLLGAFKNESFESADEVEQALLVLVSENAVVRTNDSNRTP